MIPRGGFGVALLLLAAGLAGCLAGEASEVQTFDPDDSSYVPPEEQAAAEPEVVEVDEEMPTGSIVGKVLDDEQLPVGNATVALVGYNTTAKTTRLGDFKFGVVNAGHYFLVVRHPDYKETQVGASVEPDAATELMVTVEAKPKPVPHVEVLPTVLYLNCRAYVKVLDSNMNTNSKGFCSGDLSGEYSESWYSDHKVTQPGLVGVLAEIQWERSTDGSKCLQWEVYPLINGWDVGWRVAGQSPLALTVTDQMLRDFHKEDPESRAHYYRDGGSFRIEADAHPCVLGTPVDVGVAMDQAVDVNLTFFFVNEPEAYEEYRAFS